MYVESSEEKIIKIYHTNYFPSGEKSYFFHLIFIKSKKQRIVV